MTKALLRHEYHTIRFSSRTQYRPLDPISPPRTNIAPSIQHRPLDPTSPPRPNIARPNVAFSTQYRPLDPTSPSRPNVVLSTQYRPLDPISPPRTNIAPSTLTSPCDNGPPAPGIIPLSREDQHSPAPGLPFLYAAQNTNIVLHPTKNPSRHSPAPHKEWKISKDLLLPLERIAPTRTHSSH